MQPGGYDKVLPGPVTRNDRDFLFRMVRAHWPDAVWKDCEEPNQVPVSDLWIHTKSFPWSSTEFFIYKKPKSRAFIHVLTSLTELTLVVGSRAMVRFTDEMFLALRINRLS